MLKLFRKLYDLHRELVDQPTFREPTAEDYQWAERAAKELRASLPSEFRIVGKKYPDLVFRHDPQYPGLFIADVPIEYSHDAKRRPDKSEGD